MKRPLCFVLMPFGCKPSAGGVIDFDAVYTSLVKPAIQAADLEPLRADEEMAGGIIHKPMFERLILCEYAVADLTTANANVFYELGLRHAVRRKSTVLLFAKDVGQLPFDVSLLRAMPYALGRDGKPAQPAGDGQSLEKLLRAARDDATDSPVYQLVEDFPDVQRLKTDVFRDRVQYSESVKKKLFAARQENHPDAVKAVADGLEPLADQPSGVVIDLFLSFRAVQAWEEMIALVSKMAPPLAATVMVREQLGLALNRAGRSQQAEKELTDLIADRGPSSETYGILGRVHKDAWQASLADGNEFLAAGLLDKAIEAYLKGFESDWRDAYPGINAATLMEVKTPPDPRGRALIPIVAYAVERRIAAGQPDYWDFATLLELAVLEKDKPKATRALTDALARVRETWEPETTARNLGLIRRAREDRGDGIDWAAQIEAALLKQSHG